LSEEQTIQLKEFIDKEFFEELITIFSRITEKATMLLHMQVPSSYSNGKTDS
jgi:hypothetical protein